MTAQRGGYPVEIAVCLGNDKIRQLCFFTSNVTTIAFGLFLRVFRRQYTGQNEFFPGARHGHIENTHFLSLGFSTDFRRHRLPGQGFIDLPSRLGALGKTHANA